MNKFEEIKKEIATIISKSLVEEDPGHSIKTLEWVLKLNPKADEALQVAALAHDIERTGPSGLKNESQEEYEKRKQEHARNSAKIISSLMEKYNYPEEVVNKVRHLVRNHEVGGDEETNILMQADSLSYFDNNVNFYYRRNGPEKTKKKIRFMIKRTPAEVRSLIGDIKQKNPEIDKLIKEVLAEEL